MTNVLLKNVMGDYPWQPLFLWIVLGACSHHFERGPSLRKGGTLTSKGDPHLCIERYMDHMQATYTIRIISTGCTDQVYTMLTEKTS